MRTHFQPAPVGGWNESMPLDLMPPTDCVALINFIPREKSLEFRKGSKIITDAALATSVETLAVHRQEDGTETLLATANDAIYSINLSTGVATEENKNYSNNRWQTVNFNDFLLFVNGADAPQQYDGTTLGNYASPLSGVTATNVKGVTVFKGRAIYWENNAAKFWYAAAGAYGGAVTSFPLAVVTRKGGYVVECCTWTRDSGSGADDLFVVIMSTGETLVYQGSNPGSDFALIGSFNLGKPLSIRGSTNLASDRIILTEDGFINLSTALQVGRATDKGNVGSKIIEAAKRVTNKYKNNYGWEVFYNDSESLLIVNIPRDDEYHQYCMNTNTGAWTRFKGWDGITFAEIGGDLYMGGSDGHVRKCFTGSNDDDVAISHKVTPAFTMTQMPDRKKQLCFVTIFTNFIAKDNIGVGGLQDFEARAFGGASVPQTTRGQTGEWGVSNWGEDYWGTLTSNDIQEYIYPVSADGFALSAKINIYSDAQTASIYSLRYKYKVMRTI